MAADAAASTTCTIVAVRGRVLITDAQGNERTAKNTETVAIGETIETGPGGFLDLTLDYRGKNITRIEGDTKAVVRSVNPGRIEIVDGGVFAKLRAIPKGSEFQIETPVAMAAVRGSAYRTRHLTGEGTSVYNYSSSNVYVYAKDADGKAVGEPVTLNNQEKTEVKKEGDAPQEPELMTTGEKSSGFDDLTKLESYDRSGEHAFDDNREDIDGGDDDGGHGDGAGTDEDAAREMLKQLTESYEGKDMGEFLKNVAPDFEYRGEFEEFARRDFRDFGDIRINLFFKRIAPAPQGWTVQADWELQVFPTATDRPIVTRGTGAEFVFNRDGDRLVLQSMRGGHPLFAGRSPEIAALSGVPANIVSSLDDLQNSPSRAARQSAIALLGDGGSADPRTTPVDIEILPIEHVLDQGDNEDLINGGIGSTDTIRMFVEINFLSNPLNVTLTDVLLEVTDSNGGVVRRGRGNIVPGQTSRITTTDTKTFAGVQSGTFTYVIDPNHEFNFIDQTHTTASAAYSS